MPNNNDLKVRGLELKVDQVLRVLSGDDFQNGIASRVSKLESVVIGSPEMPGILHSVNATRRIGWAILTVLVGTISSAGLYLILRAARDVAAIGVQ